MITKTIAAGLVAITALSVAPASASALSVEFGFRGPGWSGHGDHHRRHYRLSTNEIRWILRKDGYRQIRFVDDRGPVYQLRANKHGRNYFLVVSARDGDIISRHRF